MKYTEKDLDIVISKSIDDLCKDYPTMCELSKTKWGKERIAKRIKQILFNDGITDVETAIAKIETQLRFPEDENNH